MLLIAFFNWYYTFLQLEPKDLAEQLKRQVRAAWRRQRLPCWRRTYCASDDYTDLRLRRAFEMVPAAEAEVRDYCLEGRCASTAGTQSPTGALLHARCELKVPLRAAQGASIPAVRPGRKTAEFITETLKNMSVLGSVFLGALAVRLPGHLLCICLHLPISHQAQGIFSLLQAPTHQC